MSSKSKIKLNAIMLLFGFTMTAVAQTININIRDRIETKNFYRKVYPTLFGQKEFRVIKKFGDVIAEQSDQTVDKINKFIYRFDNIIPSNIMMPLIYWRYIKQDDNKVAETLSFFMLYKLLTIRDLIDNPLQDDVSKRRAQQYLKVIAENDDINSSNIFAIAMPEIKEQAKEMADISNDDAFIETVGNNHIIKENIKDRVPQLPNFVLSYLGFIPGNKVELISQNDQSPKRVTWVNDRVIFNGGTLDFSKDYMKMPTPKSSEGHIAFTEDPIFIKIRDMIDSARESIFIDIFLLGGTMGGTLAKYLIDQTVLKHKQNPYFKTLLLHDYATNYNMWSEMSPVFEYIRSRIENEPDVAECMMLIQANIQRHPPGIPFGLTNLIPKTPEVFNVIEPMATYYESKIDHSKVIVVDAKSDHPRAYFGSKNWTDHSGAYYYDNAIYVEGPVAALVQASYYNDIDAALTLDPIEQNWFYYKDKGFSNEHYLDRRDEILAWMKINRNNYPVINPTPEGTVRIAEADVDGIVKNVRNIIIDSITQAKNNIYMEQLFIYDKYIADALVKLKKSNSSLDIKIIADTNGNFGMNGFPNTIFMKELMDNGVEIRARNTTAVPITFPDGSQRTYHQENHRKIISVDGKILIGGSSNLNPDTLQGSFREFGAQIFDKNDIKKFERDFLDDWADNRKTKDFNINSFKMRLKDKELPLGISALINNLGATIIRSKDQLENKY